MKQFVRAALKLGMSVALVPWVFMWLARPLNPWQDFWRSLQKHPITTGFNATAPYVIFYVAPIIFVGTAGALAFSRNKRASRIRSRGSKSFRSNPWTYPLFTRGALSIVSAADFIFLSSIVIFTGYTFTAWYINSAEKIMMQNHQPKLATVGTLLGLAGTFCMGILFFPITRGSSILKLMNIPFEHAVRFHTWIATTMLVTWTAHGLVYVLHWIIENQIQELWSWHRDAISGLPGLIALIIGLVMRITSLSWVRKKNFELFYYTHHLYLLFILFYGLHLGDKLYTTLLGGALLFLGSRLMRSIQSQQKVDVLSARFIGEETVELVLPKQPELHYSAASFVFLNLPAVSRLQWHPFTIISSSNVEPDRLTLLIKKNGDWTSQLLKMLQNARSGARLQLEAGIEGPYGHDLDYISRYGALIFIAGGSGVSPFISLLKEILYNVQIKQLRPPKKIIFVYAVKTSAELRILRTISPALICPELLENPIKINVQAYVTREQGIDVEAQSLEDDPEEIIKLMSKTQQAQQVRAVSPPLAANGIVEAAVILASFFGSLFFAGIIRQFYIYKFISREQSFPRSAKGFLAFIETLLGVLVSGGATAVAGNWFLKKKSSWAPHSTPLIDSNSCLKPDQVQYGQRPDFRRIFSENKLGHANVGVFVCGPLSMQQDVAALCKESREHTTFNYHSMNFDL